MKNLVSIIEIPTTDFARAVSFYKAILDISIEEVDMGGIMVGSFLNEDKDLHVQLIHGNGYEPSANGTIIYLNAGEDLQPVTNKIEANGGKILMPKSEIGPEMGFYAMFKDIEGNKIGLYSLK